jgi:hypothetical protein
MRAVVASCRNKRPKMPQGRDGLGTFLDSTPHGREQGESLVVMLVGKEEREEIEREHLAIAQ